MSFIHLHLHTEYSLADGLIKITDLASTVANMNMPAISITEKNNVFSAIKFYRAMRNQGIKPLIGADLNLVSEKKDEFTNKQFKSIPNLLGYSIEEKIKYRIAKLLSEIYSVGENEYTSEFRAYEQEDIVETIEE